MRPGVPQPGDELTDTEVPADRSFNAAPLVLLVVAAVLAIGGWKVLGSDPWLRDLPSGLEAAQASGKPILALFTADWCPPCKHLKRNILSDSEVDALINDACVRVKIDLTNRQGPNAGVAQQYGVRGIPTMILYDPGGLEIDRVVGAPSDPAAMTAWLNSNGVY